MSPEERERILTRMREGGGRGPFGGGDTGGGDGAGRNEGTSRDGQGTNAGRGRPGAQAAAPQSRTMATGATTIDSLFGPLPVMESRGMAWLWMSRQLKPVRLRLGVSDGTYTEVMNEQELQPGMEVVLNVTTGLEPQARPGQGGTSNPLMGPQRGFPGGGRQGGGGTGGRGR